MGEGGGQSPADCEGYGTRDVPDDDWRLRRCFYGSSLDHLLLIDVSLAPAYSSFDWLPECGRR
jgi:hypothetical protein